jgi:hypothetical protein
VPLPIVIAHSARIDLVAAAEWYEEREPDSISPLELFEEFDETIALVVEHPEAFPKYDGEIRRAVLKRFPYGIYYVIEPDVIAVLYFIAMAQEEGPPPR